MKTKHTTLILIFLLALLLRVSYLALMATVHSSDSILNLFPDSHSYTLIAKDILNETGEANRVASDYRMLFRGPGYAGFLAICFAIFGISVWPILVIQIILSSLNTVLVVLLTKRFLPEWPRTALMAGLLCATSLTAIALSCSILTETLFVSLFLVSLMCWWDGLVTGHWRYFIIAGLLLGCGCLVRSAGQFWVLGTIILSWIIARRQNNYTLLLKTAVYASLVLVIILGWVARNYYKHHIIALEVGSVSTVKYYLGVKVYARIHHQKDIVQIRETWGKDEAIQRLEYGERSHQEIHHQRILFALDLIKRYPWEVMTTFFGLVYENISEKDSLHYMQLPQFQGIWRKIRKGYKLCIRLSLILMVIGCFQLWRAKKYLSLVVLLTIYAYFALISGLTFWQGSRILFPAQVSWAILISAAFIVLKHSMETLGVPFFTHGGGPPINRDGPTTASHTWDVGAPLKRDKLWHKDPRKKLISCFRSLP